MALEFITSLFKNKSKKGVDYLVGNTMDGKYKYLVFRNTKKEVDNQPDYHLYRSLNEEFEPPDTSNYHNKPASSEPINTEYKQAEQGTQYEDIPF